MIAAGEPIAPAEVIEICKRHDRPEGAFRALHARITALAAA